MECIDLCDDDPDKTDPGACGCGVPEGTCGTPQSEFYSGTLGSLGRQYHGGVKDLEPGSQFLGRITNVVGTTKVELYWGDSGGLPACQTTYKCDLPVPAGETQGRIAVFCESSTCSYDLEIQWVEPAGSTTSAYYPNESLSAYEFRQLDSFSVTPGSTFGITIEKVSFYGSGFVQWDQNPTAGTYACKTNAFGDGTDCDSLQVPAGVTTAHVAIDAGGNGAVLNVTVDGIAP